MSLSVICKVKRMVRGCLVINYKSFLKKCVYSGHKCFIMNHFSLVQSLSRVRLCDPMNHSMPGLPVHHQSLLKPMSIESVMPSNHLILRRPLLLLP